jgi:hypothetical protein
VPGRTTAASTGQGGPPDPAHFRGSVYGPGQWLLRSDARGARCDALDELVSSAFPRPSMMSASTFGTTPTTTRDFPRLPGSCHRRWRTCSTAAVELQRPPMSSRACTCHRTRRRVCRRATEPLGTARVGRVGRRGLRCAGGTAWTPLARRSDTSPRRSPCSPTHSTWTPPPRALTSSGGRWLP